MGPSYIESSQPPNRDHPVSMRSRVLRAPKLGPLVMVDCDHPAVTVQATPSKLFVLFEEAPATASGRYQGSCKLDFLEGNATILYDYDVRVFGVWAVPDETS